ncbi:hypothetical protein [Synechococcus sp. RedBA-s]|uniref:hypothetical protein n=1 Tax=Synechococcus sp. RedBA-s TaxID=2823741 RepID=UPI0020CE27F2|nr:hypothetical protein [Synechococcus sp. RedBA-s]MCP9800077.1 hypothetical protein [Synechococcus sp. RedBA-s]
MTSNFQLQGDPVVIPIRYLICSRLLGTTTRLLLLLGAISASLGEWLLHSVL